MLKPSIWVYALIRRAQIGSAYAVLARKGDADGGAVLVKVITLDGNAVLYTPMRNMDGERIWLASKSLSEGEIDQMIAKRVQTDPDLWVVEIEDKKARHFIEEKIETI